MNRRDFCAGGLALAAATLPAMAEESCDSRNVCKISINVPRLFARHGNNTQQTQFWCWAASISNIFAYYEHPVRQDRIVREAYGAVVPWPGFGFQMSNVLNRRWRDDNGEEFESRLTGLFDRQAGIFAINNYTIHKHMSDENPLIIGSGSHAMLVTGITYTQSPMGPYIFESRVFDPWPGRGMRTLPLQDISVQGGLVYLASIEIED
jgi:hypothetical protein